MTEEKDCVTCLHRSVKVSREPCSHCVAAFNKGLHYTSWEPSSVKRWSQLRLMYEKMCSVALQLGQGVESDGAESDGPAPVPEGGRKDDKSKPRWSLLPWGPLRSVVDVLTDAVASGRYEDNSWQAVPNARDRYFSATQRHLTAWWSGEQSAQDSKLPHLAHAICNLLFLLWFDQTDKK